MADGRWPIAINCRLSEQEGVSNGEGQSPGYLCLLPGHRTLEGGCLPGMPRGGDGRPVLADQALRLLPGQRSPAARQRPHLRRLPWRGLGNCGGRCRPLPILPRHGGGAQEQAPLPDLPGQGRHRDRESLGPATGQEVFRPWTARLQLVRSDLGVMMAYDRWLMADSEHPKPSARRRCCFVRPVD